MKCVSQGYVGDSLGLLSHAAALEIIDQLKTSLGSFEKGIFTRFLSRVANAVNFRSPKASRLKGQIPEVPNPLIALHIEATLGKSSLIRLHT